MIGFISKNKMKLAVIGAIYGVILTFVACSVNKDFQVTTNEVDVLRNRGYMANVKELKEGYGLYVSKCGGCHNLYTPSKYTKSEWELNYLQKEFTKAKVDLENERKLISYFIYSKAK
jgi:hypothetical protein